MPNSLIHIGLHKTGSSALLGVCRAMGTINVSREYCTEIGRQLREIIWGLSQEDFRLPEDVALFDEQIKNEEAFSFFVNESFSNPGVEFYDLEKFSLYHEYCAEVMQAVAADSKILLTVREPASWVYSMYKQHVQEGGSYTFKRYLAKFSPAISEILCIDKTLKPWIARFGADKIVVLPAEMQRTDTNQFFANLAKSIGMPEQKFVFTPVGNKSLNDDEAEFLRLCSRWMDVVIDAIPFGADSRKMYLENAQVIVNILRRQLQNEPHGKLSRLANRVVTNPAPDWQLPENVVESIKRHYLPTIERYLLDGHEYFESYSDSL